MKRWNRTRLGMVAVGASAALVALGIQPATARARVNGPRTLYVAPTGTYTSIQAAVNAARPGDWILIAAGDYHEVGSANAGVLITTPNLHVRGLNRKGVIVDGTLAGAPTACDPEAQWQDYGPIINGAPSGRNGIEVLKASGVTIENLTVCNFLAGASGSNGNQIWWNGGDGSGSIGLGRLEGRYLTASSTFFQDAQSAMAKYGIFTSNENGPGLLAHTYASNMGDSSYYVGACPDCNVVLTDAHAQNSALGFSGTNAGGHLIIENSQWDHNRAGIVPNSLNNDDAPPPQNGACPSDPTRSCTIIRNNRVHDNNNPNTPEFGIAGAAPIGAGIELSGSQNDTVTGNLVTNQGGWGIVVNDYPDSEAPPPQSHCQGGIQQQGGVCYFLAFGNQVLRNRLASNGTFGNTSNGDLLDATITPLPGEAGNCFVGNRDLNGPLTSDPAMIEMVMGTCRNTTDPPPGDPSAAGQLLCATGGYGTSCGNYPTTTRVMLLPIPANLTTMPSPCKGVPDNGGDGPC